jgi:hypothetical protein
MSTNIHEHEWLSLSEAAKRFGVNRNTLALWSKGRVKRLEGQRLRTKKVRVVRNLLTTLINVADLREIVAAGVRPGRPSSARARLRRSRETPSLGD